MDYEKKYKEALEQAKFYHGNCPSEPERKKLEKIFPELKESEDERVRKWIYSLVENLGYPADEDVEKELEEMQPLALAYLEKQKEQKPEDEREYVRTLKSLISDFLRGKDHIDRGYYQQIYDWLDRRHLEGMGFINKEERVQIGN